MGFNQPCSVNKGSGGGAQVGEDQVPSDMSNEYSDLWNECKKTKNITNFADCLSGVLYCVREEKLGNHYLSPAKKRYISKINEFSSEEWALPFIDWINLNYAESHD